MSLPLSTSNPICMSIFISCGRAFGRRYEYRKKGDFTMKLNGRRPRFSLLMFLLTLMISATAAAVQAKPAPELTGRFAVRYGDTIVNGQLVSLPTQAGIYDQSGVYHPIDLSAHPMTDQQIHNLFGKEVNLFGLQTTAKGLAPESITTSSILQDNPLITGPQPWATVLCSLKGSPTPKPHPVSWYNGMYRSQFPSIEDYWEKMTNGALFGFGPNVYGWYDAGESAAAFKNSDGSVDLERLWNVCTAKADSDVNFPNFVGVALFFDDDLGGAWGGASSLSLDGQTRSYRSLWYSNYEDPLNFVTHEMGHGYNMNHSQQSSSPYDEYQDPYTQMSALWLKCDVVRDPTYGCIPLGFDAWDLFQGGWIRVKNVDPGQYKEETIEPLYVNGGKTQALVLRLNDTKSVFVEARKLAGYDAKLFFAGVVLHAIDTSTYPFSRLINVANNKDDTTKGALLTAAGKKYTDPHGQFTVCLNSISGGNYSLAAYIGGDCDNPPKNPTPVPDIFETVPTIDCAGNFTVAIINQSNVNRVQWFVDGRPVSPGKQVNITSIIITIQAQVLFKDGKLSTYDYTVDRSSCPVYNVYVPLAHS